MGDPRQWFSTRPEPPIKFPRDDAIFIARANRGRDRALSNYTWASVAGRKRDLKRIGACREGGTRTREWSQGQRCRCVMVHILQRAHTRALLHIHVLCIPIYVPAVSGTLTRRKTRRCNARRQTRARTHASVSVSHKFHVHSQRDRRRCGKGIEPNTSRTAPLCETARIIE